ncbi:trypsin-like serine protease [Enterobacter ludwigii]|uniref:trypsin-like serine protease n=1 Tax=Enterobacter ludwigii TaxID=299767 RepID=UPI003976943F
MMIMKKKQIRLAGLLLAAALPLSGACSAPTGPAVSSSGEPHLTTGKAITGGQDYPSAPPSWIAYIKDAGGNCTGQFITPSLVMTARHCVFDNEGNKLAASFSVYWAGSDAKTLPDENGVPVQDIIPWKGTKGEPQKDVVLLKLSKPYPAGVKVVTSAPLFHGYAFRPNDFILPMGYGKQEPPGKKLKWATIITRTLATDGVGGDAVHSQVAPTEKILPDYPPSGSNDRGDSGGPVLSMPFTGEAPHPATGRPGKIVAVSSFGDEVDSMDSLINKDTLIWIAGQDVPVIKTPVDGQTFARDARTLTVTWYGDKSFSSVTLKRRAADGTLSDLNPPGAFSCQGSACTLSTDKLFEAGSSAPSDYTILATRADGSQDSVDIRLIPDGKPLNITFPEKSPEETFKTTTTYTLTGTGNPGDTLRARLSASGNGNDTPCQDTDGVVLQAVTVSPQGDWSCTLPADPATRNAALHYRFEISVLHDTEKNRYPQAASQTPQPVTTDTVSYSVDGRNVTPLIIDKPPAEYSYVDTFVDLPLLGGGTPGRFLVLNTNQPRSEAHGAKVDENGKWLIRYTRGDWDKTTLTVSSYLTEEAATLQKNPLETETTDVSFVHAEFTNPEGELTTISPLLPLPLEGEVKWNGATALNLRIDAFDEKDKTTTTLCKIPAGNSANWSCTYQGRLTPGRLYTLNMYGLFSGGPGKSLLAHTQVIVSTQATFLTPIQVSRSGEGDVYPLTYAEGKGIEITGRMPVSEYRDEDYRPATADIYRLENGTSKYVKECSLGNGGAGTEEGVAWYCRGNERLTLVEAGQYGVVAFFKQEGSPNETSITTYFSVGDGDITFTSPEQVFHNDKGQEFDVQQATDPGITITGFYNRNIEVQEGYMPASARIYPADKPDEPTASCGLEKDNSPKAGPTINWRCVDNKPVEIPKDEASAGRYQIIVTFTRKGYPDKTASTYFTLLDGSAPSIRHPDNGSTTSVQTVSVSGKAAPGADLNVALSGSSGTSGKMLAGQPDCQTRASSNGYWSCAKPFATPTDGVYTVNATDTDDNKQAVPVHFTVKHDKKPDANDPPASPPGLPALPPPPLPPFPPPPPGGKPPFPPPPPHHNDKCPVGEVLSNGKCAFRPGSGSDPGNSGLPAGRICPPDYTYDAATHNCTSPPPAGPVSADGCPGGYQLSESGQCYGPPAGGPAFSIASPYNGQIWDCGNDCHIYGQVPEGDTVMTGIYDADTAKWLSGAVPAVTYNNDPTLWQVPITAAMPAGHKLEVFAWRIHNDSMLSSPDATQGLEVLYPRWLAITTPATGTTLAESYQITGTGQPGARVTVSGLDDTCQNVAVGSDGSWNCGVTYPAVEGSYRITAVQTYSDQTLGVPAISDYSIKPVVYHLFILTPEEHASITTFDSNDQYSLTGTARPDTDIVLYAQKDGRTFDASLCRTRSSDRGEWSCKARDGSNGSYTIYGQYADKSVTSEKRHYRIALNRQVTINYPQEGARDWRRINQPYMVSGTGRPGDTVTVSGINNDTGEAATSPVSQAQVANDGTWSFPLDIPAAGDRKPPSSVTVQVRACPQGGQSCAQASVDSLMNVSAY